MTHHCRLQPPQPFALDVAVRGHGWYDLEPHTYADGCFATVLRIDGQAVDAAVRESSSALAVRLSAPVAQAAKTQLARMLRLDLDLEPFWALCDAEARLRWARARGAGRLLRSAHAFEDLIKLLFTTNCSWAATRLMTSRLVAALGEPAPSGRRAFPGPELVAAQPERFFRDVVRAGYRSRACLALARAFAAGTLSDAHFSDPELDATTLRNRLLALDGFGPYAAGQALRLFGHHDDLALDSWCRAELARRAGRSRAPSDRAVAKVYARFGRWRGLALWVDLTTPWFH